MQEKTLSFNKTGYDPFLDFIKAWAIICVIFGHTFPYLDQIGYSLWLGTQVPLFILIQIFHSYKKGHPKFNLKKILTRVLVPFILCETLVFILALLLGADARLLIMSLLSGGGYGPGSYYPWLYLQMAIVLPLVYPILNKLPRTALLWVFLIICEGLEIVCSVVNFPDQIYRLLAIRYIFLIYLALEWIENGIVLNRKMLFLSFLSLATIVYFRYFSVNDEPWFYNTAWKTARWPCYYYVANLYVYVLYLLWTAIRKHSFFSKCVNKIAASTYEIFLVQMSVIYLFHADKLSILPNKHVASLLWFVIVWVVSIGLGITINELRLRMIR